MKKMKNFVLKSENKKENASLNIFSFSNEKKIEVLENHEMNQIRGGYGEEEDNTNQEWK